MASVRFSFDWSAVSALLPPNMAPPATPESACSVRLPGQGAAPPVLPRAILAPPVVTIAAAAPSPAASLAPVEDSRPAAAPERWADGLPPCDAAVGGDWPAQPVTSTSRPAVAPSATRRPRPLGRPGR